jgi:histidine phosphotransferase ChpT
MKVDLLIAQLLCSRLCHDLLGPAGAVGVGVDMLTEGADERIDALGLLGRSAHQVIGKLAFYRVAFGLGGLRETDSPKNQARLLISSLINSGNVRLDWPEAEAISDLSADACKLLLNMALLAHSALIRGGDLGIRIVDIDGGVGLAALAIGDRARLRDEIRVAAQESLESYELTPHTVQAALTRLLAEDMNAELEVTDTGQGEVRIAALIV